MRTATALRVRTRSYGKKVTESWAFPSEETAEEAEDLLRE